MPDLDSDASREKVRDLELGFKFTGSPVQFFGRVAVVALMYLALL